MERNGFGPDGGQALGDCVKQNRGLEELNINANRLNTSNAFAIAQGLLSNESLEVLYIDDNQINCDGVLAVFLCIKANEGSQLRLIDFSVSLCRGVFFSFIISKMFRSFSIPLSRKRLDKFAKILFN